MREVVYKFYDPSCDKLNWLLFDISNAGFHRAVEMHWYQGAYFHAIRVFYRSLSREFVMIRAITPEMPNCGAWGFIVTDSDWVVEKFSNSLETFERSTGGVDLVLRRDKA